MAELQFTVSNEEKIEAFISLYEKMLEGKKISEEFFTENIELVIANDNKLQKKRGNNMRLKRLLLRGSIGL